MNFKKRRIKTISKESGFNNIYINPYSKEGKNLIEVVKKESTLKKIKNK